MGTFPEGPAVSQVDVRLREASVVPATGTTAMEPTPIAARPLKVIRPPTFSISTIFVGVRTLAQYSDLLYTLSLFRLNVRYKQSVLGWSWAILQPLALMCIYTVIFTRVTTIATGGTPYPVFVFSGLLPWIFFSASISSAVQGLVLHPNLLTKMYFPREIIPLSYLAAGLADFCIASLMRFRDVGLAMPFVLQVWMFTVPVVYSLQSVPVRFRRLYLLDPAAGLIDNFRMVVLGGTAPNAASLLTSSAITILCLGLAYAYFKSSEATMADVI